MEVIYKAVLKIGLAIMLSYQPLCILIAYLDLFDEETKTFEVSKIPDIYDSIKYDVLHNSNVADLPDYVSDVQIMP